jgi:hypothetical protein
MSPIDDELRAALQGRAQAVTPTPDPLTGIEQRAKRIQRTRIGAAVAGSALAVALVAAVVPAVQSATSDRNDVPRVASAQPTPTPAPATSPYALDPLDPWDYRGADLELLGPGTLGTIERDFGARHGARSVELSPLFGQFYDPSQQFTLFFVADVEMADGVHQYFWGVSETPGESGPEFVVDEPLAEPAMALAAGLEGDEVGRLIVVADPAVDEIAYAEDGSGSFRTATPLADGVGIIAMTGDPASDSYVVFVQGEEVHRAPAPDVAASEQPDRGPSSAAALDPGAPWELRGETALLEDGHLAGLADDFATRRNVDRAGVEVVPLYVQSGPTDADLEVAYLVRDREGPWFWGVSALFEGGWWWFTEHELQPGTAALAALLPRGDQDPQVLVVAAPWMGGAVYAAAGEADRPMQELDAGVYGATVREPVAGTRYKVLDGNGDLDNPVAEGQVPPYQNTG